MYLAIKKLKWQNSLTSILEEKQSDLEIAFVRI